MKFGRSRFIVCLVVFFSFPIPASFHYGNNFVILVSTAKTERLINGIFVSAP